MLLRLSCRLHCEEEPVNDEPAGAIPVDPLFPWIVGSTGGATFGEADTPEMRALRFDEFPIQHSRGAGSVWFTWKSPISGVIRCQFSDSSFGDRLFLQERPPVGARDITDGAFVAEKDTEYLLSVVGPQQLSGWGDFGLMFQFVLGFPIPQLQAFSTPRGVTLGVAFSPGAELDVQACSASWQFESIAHVRTNERGFTWFEVAPLPEAGFQAYRVMIRP